MSADHKRPMLAFVLVALACLLIVAHTARSEAVRSVLDEGADRVVAGVRLALEDDDPVSEVPPAVAVDGTTSFDRDSRPAPSPAAPSASATPRATLPSTRAVRASRHFERRPGAVHSADERATSTQRRVPPRAAPAGRTASQRTAPHATRTAPHASRSAVTVSTHGRPAFGHAQSKAHGHATGHLAHARSRSHGAPGTGNAKAGSRGHGTGHARAERHHHR